MHVELVKMSDNVIDDLQEAVRKTAPNLSVNLLNEDDQKRVFSMLIRKGKTDVFTHAHCRMEIHCSECAANELLAQNVILTKQDQAFSEDLTYICPKQISDDSKSQKEFFDLLEQATKLHKKFLKKYGDQYDARYVLPGAVETKMIITANFLSWLKILKLERYSRTSEELKEICGMIYEVLNQSCPSIFNKTNLKMKI